MKLSLSAIAGFLLVLALTEVAYGQSAFLDSLRRAADTMPPSTQKVDALNQLSFECYDFNDSVALVYANEAMALARKLDYQRGIRYALLMQGIGYRSRGEYASAIRSFSTAVKMDVPNDEATEIYGTSLLATSYRDLAYYDSSELFFDRALRKALSVRDSSSLVGVYKNISNLNIVQWKNREALNHALLAERYISRGTGINLRVEVLSSKGRAYLGLLQFDSAAVAFTRMCAIVPEGDYYHRIHCSLQWANYHSHLGDYSEALYHAFEALKLSNDYVYPPQLVELYQVLGETYAELSQNELAAKYLFEALKLTDRHKLRYQYARVCSNLAWVYKSMRDYGKALDFIDRSQAVREAIQDRHGISNSLNIRGLIYLEQGKLDEAIVELEKALAIRQSIQHLEGVSGSIFNLALVYEQKGDLKKAQEYQARALEIDAKIGNKQSLGISYNSLGELTLRQRNMGEAYRYLTLGRAMADQTRSRLLLLRNYGLWSQYYEAAGNFAEAYRYQKLYQQLNDSIYQTSTRTKLAEMEALYQIEQRDQQIKLLSQEKLLAENQNKLQKTLISQQRIIILSGVVGLALVLLFTWNFYRGKKSIQRANREILEQKEEIQAQSEELVEANQTIAQINRDLEEKVESRTSELKQAYKELDTFFYRSSHDFRRPLTTFLGLAEVAKITVKDHAALELFDKVRETAQNLDKMLVKLQSISDVGGQELLYREVFLKEIYDNVVDHYRDIIQARNIDVSFYAQIATPFFSYPAMVKIILENLLENSIHFSSIGKPIIQVKAIQQGTLLVLTVTDNGQGIEEEYQSRVFEMYYRANHASKGNGLGLYIVMKAVEKLKGDITFTSVKNAGTTFTVTLPMTLQ